jgi:hypothetical protein
VTKILVCALAAYAMVALCAILIDDGVTGAGPRRTNATIVVTANPSGPGATNVARGVGEAVLGDWSEEWTEEARQSRAARTRGLVGAAIEGNRC